MAKREYDLVVFGATGFTGREVCFHLAELRSLRAPVRWAVAGRCRAKLLTLCEEIERLSTRGEWCFDQALSLPDGILVGDVEDEATLRSEVTAKTRCLLNCTGPYRFLGEPVVAACIATGTDYLDLCGEPEFMDRIFLKYHAAAEAASVFVVHACAFDSVPADLGVLFTATEAFCSPAICTSIESYLTVTSGAAGMAGHVTTFAAAVHGFGSVKQLALLRRQIQASAPPRPAPIGGAQALHPRRPVPWFWSNVARQYALKFPGADAAVVRNSQRGLLALAHSHADPMVLHAVRRKIPQYSAYFTVGRSLWSCVKTVVIGGVFSFLAAREWGRKLLLRYPEIFSAGLFSARGPTKQQRRETSFRFVFDARGFADETCATEAHALVSVSGPEPGYVATPKIFLAVAATLLEERETLKGTGGNNDRGVAQRGGVFTPGAVFGDTSLVARLRESGINFAVERRSFLPSPQSCVPSVGHDCA